MKTYIQKKNIYFIVLILVLIAASLLSRLSKMESSKPHARIIAEAAQDIVRQERLDPPSAARFYAYTLGVYSDTYNCSKNNDYAEKSFWEVALYLYPHAKNKSSNKDMSEIKCHSIVESYLKRSKTDNFPRANSELPVKTPIKNGWTFILPPFAPSAGTWKRFLVEEEYVIPAPPNDIASDYKKYVEEVRSYNKARTQKDAEDIDFFAGGIGTETPAGIWQNIFYEEAKEMNLSNEEYAEMQKILAFSLADSFYECWKQK